MLKRYPRKKRNLGELLLGGVPPKRAATQDARDSKARRRHMATR